MRSGRELYEWPECTCINEAIRMLIIMYGSEQVTMAETLYLRIPIKKSEWESKKYEFKKFIRSEYLVKEWKKIDL